jgi:hypothetical protein
MRIHLDFTPLACNFFAFCSKVPMLPTHGEVSDESATGNELNAFNRPSGTEVILGVGASHQANRSRDPLGLPP